MASVRLTHEKFMNVLILA